VVLVAVAPLLALPGHLLWRLGQDVSLPDRVATITDTGAGANPWEALAGLLSDTVADPLAAMAPPLILILVLLPWWRKDGARPAPRWDRVLAVFVASAMVLTLVIVLVSGGDRLRYHYLMPAATVLPAIPLLWVGSRGLTVGPRRRRALGWGLSGLAVLFALGSVVDRVWIEPRHCGRCLPLLPAEHAARAVREAGFTDGTILAANLDWGANLRPAFPDARMLARHYPDWRPPRPPGDGACLILLSRAETAAFRAGTLDPEAIRDTLEPMLDTAPPNDWLARVQVHDLPLTHAPDRTVPFGFVLLPEGLGTCR
jgi:hypothetical protein